MPQTEHNAITDLAHRLLPDWQKALLSDQRVRLIQEFCRLPERYWDVRGDGHAEAAPYAFKTDGIVFHYLPDTPIVPAYRYQVADAEQQTVTPLHPYENTHWHHATAGFRYYTHKAIEAMQADDWEQGCAYAGWLIHVLQDHSFGIHSLEGPYGTDVFVLQRLFGDPEHPEHDPAVILRTPTAPPTAASMRDYVPRLLGYQPDEIAFNLFTRHVESSLSARRLCHQIVINARADQAHLNDDLFSEMFRVAIALTADVLFSLICVAVRRIGNATAHLETIHLAEAEPYQRPWLTAPPYWTRGYTVGHALDNGGRSIPLQLRLPPRNVPVTFARGIAVGGHYHSVLAYEIPRDTYSTFDCSLGQHALFSNRTGSVHLTLKVGHKILFDDVMKGAAPAVTLHADHPEGRISLTLRTQDGLDANMHHIIWADPTLTRLPAPF
ncbi:MAG: NPCBM/NEW2 domain-containing protein [Lentisphaerae bacterium]|nr:NPCBM/NEW2 domain-containing protein [Lentisphaerota bacterium]